jgi:hypothetical protein
VAVGVLIAFVIAYGSSMLVVTGYAAYLSAQARGAPDQMLIDQFADTYAAGIGSIFIGVGTLVGGLVAGRKARAEALSNGLMVGLITAVIDLGLGIVGGLSLWAIVSFILATGGGWVGGRLSRQDT